LGWIVWTRGNATTSQVRPIGKKQELLWALIPIVFMGIVSEAGVLALGHSVWRELYGDGDLDALQVEVVGKQFEWFVRYPGKDGQFGRTMPELVHEVRNPLGLDETDSAATDDIFSRGVLRLPVGRMVQVRLRTHDVQHSFAVTAFRVKQDLVPGLPTLTQFVPTREGEYEIACAELCGLGHYKMRGTTLVLSDADFEQWLSNQFGWFE
jgi:cytochrome c oxidase subunit 2